MLASNYKQAIKEVLEDALDNLTEDELEDMLEDEGYLHENKPTISGIFMLADLQEESEDNDD